jgi:hypothetical protein
LNGIPPKSQETAVKREIKSTSVRVHAEEWLVPACYYIYIGDSQVLARHKRWSIMVPSIRILEDEGLSKTTIEIVNDRRSEAGIAVLQGNQEYRHRREALAG